MRKVKSNDDGRAVPTFGSWDAVSLTVGIVVGAGIFSLPSLVAANTLSSWLFISVWILAGALSLIGTLVYAELASAFPSAGGEYTFLRKAYGSRFAFLFAWARLCVIQTGSIALLALIFGEYAGRLFPLAASASWVPSVGLILALTGINLIGLRVGSKTQNILTVAQVSGLLVIVVSALLFSPVEAAEASIVSRGSEVALTSYGMAMVFALLTFGGWNEVACISSEMSRGGRQLSRALIAGVLSVTVLYLLTNLAYLHVLGIEGLASSSAVAGDLIRRTIGEEGAWLVSLLVALATLTSANATILTGARTTYQLGVDFKLPRLDRWNAESGTPQDALLLQGAVATVLVVVGSINEDGIRLAVDFTAPVFWCFFLATGLSLFKLRQTVPNAPRPFKVPLYPVVPIVFCLSCFYLLFSSLIYVGWGGLVGIGIVVAGLAVSFASDRLKSG